jgi:hypothetical protein
MPAPQFVDESSWVWGSELVQSSTGSCSRFDWRKFFAHAPQNVFAYPRGYAYHRLKTTVLEYRNVSITASLRIMQVPFWTLCNCSRPVLPARSPIPRWGPWRRFLDNIKMDLREIGWWIRPEFIWSNTGTTGELLWTRYWAFGHRGALGNCWLSRHLTASVV